LNWNKLKEEIVKKNIEVLAITRDIEQYEHNIAGNQLDNVKSTKRKTTLSPNSQVTLNWNNIKTSSNVKKKNFKNHNEDLDIKNIIPKDKITSNLKFELNKIEPLSTLKEELEIDETKPKRNDWFEANLKTNCRQNLENKNNETIKKTMTDRKFSKYSNNQNTWSKVTNNDPQKGMDVSEESPEIKKNRKRQANETYDYNLNKEKSKKKQHLEVIKLSRNSSWYDGIYESLNSDTNIK